MNFCLVLSVLATSVLDIISKMGRKPGQKESEEQKIRKKSDAEIYTVWMLAFATSLAVGKGLKG